MNSKNSVEEYLETTGIWKESMLLLREIFLSSGLDETIKWGGPVYTYQGRNVAGMAAFKSYAGIWFYQGALLKDEAGKLLNAQEGVTKALRQWRFDSVETISAEEELIRAYIAESVSNLKAGAAIKPEKNALLVIPDILNKTFLSDPLLKEKFDAMTLTNRRDFAEYISSAKQEKTVRDRLEKIIPMIMRGGGVQDKYKK